MGSLIKIWKTIPMPTGATVKRDGTGLLLRYKAGISGAGLRRTVSPQINSFAVMIDHGVLS